MIHCWVARPPCRSARIAGSATLTRVPSKNAVEEPRMHASSVNRCARVILTVAAPAAIALLTVSRGWRNRALAGRPAQARSRARGRTGVAPGSGAGVHRALCVHQRPGSRQRLAGLEQRLQPREDHRPAAVQLRVGALGKLVVRYAQATGVAHRLDLVSDARGPLCAHIVAPQSPEALHEPPRRFVQSFRALWSDDVRAQGTSRVTYEIEPVGDSCRLCVTHDELPEGANPQLYGGWPMILSGLKTLLETGETLTTPGSLMS